jgi:hypothetical protein
MRPPVPILALALAAPLAARGQACPGGDASPALSGVPVEQRVAFLRDRLGAERPAARAWSWTFGLVNGGLTAGQLVGAAVVRARPDRALLLAGAATSALGLAQIVLAPITPPERALAAGEEPCAELGGLERPSRAARGTSGSAPGPPHTWATSRSTPRSGWRPAWSRAGPPRGSSPSPWASAWGRRRS